MAPRIIRAAIGPYPKGWFDPMPKVVATFDDGTTKELFEFYPDEIRFSESEFVGLTEAEATRLKFNKDRAYLSS
jgi:hypothetical protein